MKRPPTITENNERGNSARGRTLLLHRASIYPMYRRLPAEHIMPAVFSLVAMAGPMYRRFPAEHFMPAVLSLAAMKGLACLTWVATCTLPMVGPMYRRFPAGNFLSVLLLVMALCLTPAEAKDLLRPVIISTDVGCETDDQIAITHALLSPELKVLGIVTTHAPNLYHNDIPTTNDSGATLTPAQITSVQANQVLAHLPAKYRCPVFTGSSVPLSDKKTPLNNAGVQFIIDQSRGFNKERKLTVIALGATTDIASALLLDPNLAKNIEIVAMGFDSWPKGGDSFNIKNDVKAWQILLDSDAHISVIDSAVSKKFLCVDQADATAIFTAHGADGKYLGALVEKWLRRNADFVKQTTGRDAWPIWDEGTIAYLLGYGHAKTYPRPILNDDTTLDHPSTQRIIHWITSIDSKEVWQDLDQKLDGIAKVDGDR